MTDKKTIVRAFNNHFFEFLDDLIRVLPENKEISYAKTSFTTIKQMNPSIIIKTWYNFIFLRYKDIIEDDNINFFIEKDYSLELSQVNKSDEIIKMIDNIRNPIREMDEKNKQYSLKYIQNLCKLSNMYNSAV
jgi:hypothetical protein